MIPAAMAYATVAGLSLEVGLYTAFVPLLVYAVFGTSRPLSVSTTSTVAILTGTALAEITASGDASLLRTATATLALLVGAILMLAGLLRLGFVANFISRPVLAGFKAGVGIAIVVDQIPKILGVHFPKKGFLHNVEQIAASLPHASLPTLALGALAIVALIALARFRPRWPGPLLVIAAAIALVVAFGVQRYGITLVGAIPAGLPPVTLPDLRLVTEMLPSATGIALMSFTETTAAARAFARPDEPTPRPNVELLATGLANAASALFGAMPGGGGTSQTAVNRSSGAHTQLAAVVTAAAALLTMLLLAPLIALMPLAALAGVVIVNSATLVKPAEFRNILRVRRTEFVWAIAAAAGVMVLGTLKGILVAIVVSLVALSRQTANPPIHVLGRKRGTNVFRPRSAEHPDDETFPGLMLIQLEGRLYFLNADSIAARIAPLVVAAAPQVLVFDLSAVFDLEYSALMMITESESRLREHGVELWLAALTPEVLAVVERSPLGATLGRERMVFNLEVAVQRYLARQRAASATPS